MTTLNKTAALGQQIWLDFLSPALIHEGNLKKLIDQGLSGVTTNPTILSTMIRSDDRYNDLISELKNKGESGKRIFERIVIEDVQKACDEFRECYEKNHFNQGYVSVEIDPNYADHSDKTIAEGRWLFEHIARPNVMIKIPATENGLKAASTLLKEGININLTLVFRADLKPIYNLYQDALENRFHRNLPINKTRAVVSLFLSRIDTALDPVLPENLQGKVALSVAKSAYQDWKEIFIHPEWKRLEKKGAHPIELLFASTSSKNPHYSELHYVSPLIGPHTINTLPEHTLDIFIQKGQPEPTLEEGIEEAKRVLAIVKEEVVDLNTLADRLQEEGLKRFKEAFNDLLKTFT